VSPTGCPAVVVLSDGARLILADGSVCRVSVRNHEAGRELACVAPSEGLYGFADEGPRVEIGLPTDEGAAHHPEVASAAEELGVGCGAIDPASMSDGALDQALETAESAVGSIEHVDGLVPGLVPGAAGFRATARDLRIERRRRDNEQLGDHGDGS